MSDHEYWSPQQIVSNGKYPFTIGQIRHYLIYRHKNGLNKVVRKVGKRIVFRKEEMLSTFYKRSTTFPLKRLLQSLKTSGGLYEFASYRQKRTSDLPLVL